jgi:glycosyltransferase involved in cell wall biosynthesis
MKSLLLNTFDSGGGAAIAAFRLNRGLRNIGVDSRMLVQFKQTDDPNIIGPASKLEKGLSLIRPELDSLPTKLYPKRNQFIFSPAFLPERVSAKVASLNPDIIHLHWLACGFLRIETISHFNRPVIWTLHDSWGFTGGCHIPFECTRYREMCGACSTLGSTKGNDLSRKNWQRKNKAWKDLNLTVVTPSHWLADCARSSSLFNNVRIVVIPNGLDIQIFKPIEKSAARSILSLPMDKKLILFGAMDSTSDKNKGFHLLQPTLKKMAKDGWKGKAELIIFGSSGPAVVPDFGLKVNYVGQFHDDVSLALLYSSVDVFVAPSIQENLPNTVMEALACGTPCVAFNIGGMPDMIEHQRNGYLAKPFEIEDMAQGIRWVLDDETRWKFLSIEARKKIEKEFELKHIAREYADLYNDILNNSKKQKE